MTEPGASGGGAAELSTAPMGLWRGNPAYRRLCSAVAISQTGDWLLFIALPLYVLQISGSALATSTVFLIELLPAVVMGTVCGPLIDRWNLGRLLSALTSLQAFVLLPLLWVRPSGLWTVYVVAAVQAGITSITNPAQQAVILWLVEPRELQMANAAVEMASNAARLIGSPLGGVLLPALGLRGLVLGDMASFLASAALLAGCGHAMPRSKLGHEAPPLGRWPAVAEGWHAVRRSTTLLSALSISFVGAIAQGLFLVLFVLFVLRSLHGGDQGSSPERSRPALRTCAVAC